MNEKNSQIIEQINAIKAKLNKYTNLKSNDKVNIKNNIIVWTKLLIIGKKII